MRTQSFCFRRCLAPHGSDMPVSALQPRNQGHCFRGHWVEAIGDPTRLAGQHPSGGRQPASGSRQPTAQRRQWQARRARECAQTQLNVAGGGRAAGVQRAVDCRQRWPDGRAGKGGEMAGDWRAAAQCFVGGQQRCICRKSIGPSKHEAKKDWEIKGGLAILARHD